MREVPCPVCEGARLKPEVLAVKVGGRSIADVCALPHPRGARLPRRRSSSASASAAIAAQVLKEIQARLGFLLDVGLDYLSLDAARRRRSPAARRSASGSRRRSAPGWSGVLYVLDEPSIGLHQRDNRRLIDTLTRLRDLGNTLIVVEHDEDTIRTADWIVDIGPGAGEHGGRVVHSGDLAGLLASPESVTGAYLSGRRSIPMPPMRRPVDRTRQAHGRRRARAQPRRASTCRSRSACLTAVTGVSGSGKSTLVNAILYTVLANELNGARQVRRPAQARHRPRAPRQGRARRPGPDRPHAAVQPRDVHRGLGPRPQAVRRDHRGQGPRLHARAGSRSTSRAVAARRAPATAR